MKYRYSSRQNGKRGRMSSGASVEQPDGPVTATTFRVAQEDGPVATVLLDALVRLAVNPVARTALAPD